MAKNSRLELGRYGEDVAAAYLSLKGWQILDRNWRCRRGELDLVAQPEPGSLAFVEVKTRSSDTCGPPEGAVTAQKLSRLRGLVSAWLTEHEQAAKNLRIDVIAVTVGGELGRSIEHFEAVG
ncbi:MAG: YraN family protein [Bifidobacteriaceae bacterium]|jgi:putative endonuclease|nr:YraN family protein [Bifidobacteriaceae bacterium]